MTASLHARVAARNANADRIPTQLSHCPCGGIPRFHFDSLGRTVETCDCGYSGPLRGQRGEPQREVRVIVPKLRPPAPPPPDNKRCATCRKVKPIAGFYEYHEQRAGRPHSATHAATCKQCCIKRNVANKKARLERERARLIADWAGGLKHSADAQTRVRRSSNSERLKS